MFGTGHSRMMIEEMFPRHGSFPGFHPIVELSLTYHTNVVGSNGQRQAMYLEHIEGFAKIILKNFKVSPPDSFLIFSHSGVNEVVVDMALEVKKRDLPVMAVVSMDHCNASPARHSSGNKLIDIADVVIDNCTPKGDAMVTVPDLPYPVGPGSTIGGAAVVNALKCLIADNLTRNGQPPYVLTSAIHVGEKTSAELFDRCYDDYRGVTAVGRIFGGKIIAGQDLARITVEGQVLKERARYLYIHQGLEKVEVDSAEAGEIIALAGLEGIAIGETLADPENPVALPPITVEEPTVKMTFGVNTSPFTGREGKWGTSRNLRERLFDELKNNVALRVEETERPDIFIVSGRGELHLAILIETMRREGYEFEVSRPEAIFHTSETGEMLEPYEELQIETSAETVGTVVEMLGSRRGKMLDMLNLPDGSVHIRYLVPTRGILGFRYQFLTATHGTGVMNSIFDSYGPMAGKIVSRTTSSVVAWETGTTNNFGLKNAEERATLFVGPGVEVYEGMVVGETPRPTDLMVNVCKKKHLTNMRSSNKDIEIRLVPPRLMSLDEAIEYLNDDELLEVTPQSIRIRKRILNTEDRGKQTKKAKELLLETE